MAKLMLIVVTVVLLGGLVLPAPQNKMELRQGDPASSMVAGAHGAHASTKTPTSQSMAQQLIRLVSSLAALVVAVVVLFVVGRLRSTREAQPNQLLVRWSTGARRAPPALA